ncbi:hypothetical protein DMN77_14950 [Paenibacillus sp. 79R4]|nr:hypothetical protein [Paenibacillus sp. 79R4]
MGFYRSLPALCPALCVQSLCCGAGRSTGAIQRLRAYLRQDPAWEVKSDGLIEVAEFLDLLFLPVGRKTEVFCAKKDYPPVIRK